MREYEVLGLKFKEYPLKEGLECFREMMKQPGIHLASYLSLAEILKIVDNSVYRDFFNHLEFVISSDPKSETKSRSESDEKGEDFLNALLRGFMASKEGVYLLCDSEDNLWKLKEILSRSSTLTENQFNIVGEAVYDELNKEAIYNKLNVECPKLIISTMSFEMQYHIMMEGRQVLNASVWLGLIPSVVDNIRAGKRIWKQGLLQEFGYRRRIDKYEKSKKNV